MYELNQHVLLTCLGLAMLYVEVSLVHYINIHIKYSPIKVRILFDFSNCPSPSCANLREIGKRNQSHCS